MRATMNGPSEADMLWLQTSSIWVLGVAAVAGFFVVVAALLRTAIHDWRSLRGTGITARVPWLGSYLKTSHRRAHGGGAAAHAGRRRPSGCRPAVFRDC